jgi:sterol desaturase/sphingolipid hydroxylase (fatty acid hydroxylase superfamily)
MEQFLASHETTIDSWILVAAFLCVALAETYRPRRTLAKPVARRWVGNLVLAVCESIPVWIYPLNVTLVALAVLKSPYGVLNRESIPFAARCALAIVVLDLLRYGVHRAFHGIPLLWRVHQIHHSDPDFDLTTGGRNHPVEVLLVQGTYLAGVAALAPPPVAVLAIGFATNVQNFFSHANLRLPAWLDRLLRPFLITPDVHRIHHSQDFGEQNANFGFFFPWWDRLFRTYVPEPAAGHSGMGIGLTGFQDERSYNPLHLLAMPFTGVAPAVLPPVELPVERRFP